MIQTKVSVYLKVFLENTKPPFIVNKLITLLSFKHSTFALFLKAMYQNEKTSSTLVLFPFRHQSLFLCPKSESHPRRTCGYEPRF